MFVEARPHSYYGGQRSLFDILEHIDRHKFTPMLLVPRFGQIVRKITEIGIRVHILPYPERLAVYEGSLLTRRGFFN